MRTFRVLVATALAVGVLAVLVSDASASVPSASTKVKKFCKAADKISSSSPSGGDRSAAKQFAKTTRTAAKLAPTSKLKSAMGTMASYADDVVDPDATDLEDLSENAGKFTRAYLVFTGYMLSNCATLG